ncbi:MAG: hypothetical protein R2867_01295 [Caldilineaceae bacterium]
MPDLAMVSVSERAWARIADVNYVGYDALLPWRNAIAERYMPYTHNWQALAGLQVSLQALLDEGLPQVYQRHSDVAAVCQTADAAGNGHTALAGRQAYCAPTVTAAHVPAGWEWPDLDQALRQGGMAVGGNYGPLAGKVFRVGHMGRQADQSLIHRGMDLLEDLLHNR